MAETLTTCIDPYRNSFKHSLAEANYQAVTIKTYRNLLRMLGRLMDANGIAPSGNDMAGLAAQRPAIAGAAQYPAVA